MDIKAGKKRLALPTALYYSLIFMGNGAFVSYIGLYYAGAKLSNAEIGMLTSISVIIVLIAQPFWGLLGDRARYKNNILVLCLFLTAASIWLTPLSSRILWLLVICTAVFYFFQCAVSPLSDTITLELASKNGFSFSRIRTVGSLGYALMAAVAGKIFEFSIDYIFLVYSVLMLSAFVFSFLVPKVEGHQRGVKKVNLLEIFKNRQLVVLYAYIFILSTTLGFFYAFHAIYSKEQGISTQIIGLGIMVGSFSQFPFMIFFDKIYKKLGIINILLLSGVIHAVRWLLYAFALTPASILIIWALHGCTYIVLYLCMAEYVNNVIIKELKASGQMMNSIVINGIGKIVGGFTGGMISSAFGIRLVFAVSSVICIAAVAGFLVTLKVSPVFKPAAGPGGNDKMLEHKDLEA